NDPEGAWAVDNLTCNKTKEERPNLFYPITDPKTNITYQANPNRVWAYEPERMKTIIAANKVIFPKSGKGTPQYKRHLKEVKSDRKPLSTWIESSTINEDSLSEEQNEYGVAIMQSVLNSQGTKTLQAIMGSQVFDYPKPVEVIKELIKQSTKDSDIVLDSFAGSGTTAHAVLNCNQEDGGNRKFILVEMEDYANDITAERVRRVIKGVPDAKDDVLKEGLGGSFTFCELGEAFDIDKILTGESLPNYNALAHYVFYTATGQSLDKEVKPAKNFLIGETDLFEIYLIYKDDLAYLRSNESALNQEKLDLIAAEKSNKQKIVFATAKYMGQSELTANKITFCQIPYAIHKIAGN
ncbi:MAG: site-specific DNA-methyltransferase, partial [Alphaproteobacteria bacterium]|nr:site-specific DNA-methyltransferase [Alphaproteobacteria bacterium]